MVTQSQFRMTGHVVSVIAALILGGTGFAYAYNLHDKITETEFFYLMCFESITVSAGIAWYAVSLKLNPTGFDLQTTPDKAKPPGTGQT